VLFIDLDNFKRVNDQCGHRAGDEVLIDVGERLRAAVRTWDLVARLAGDEFGVLLPGADQLVADALAERLVGRLSLSTANDASVVVTASIGTVTWGSSTTLGSAQQVLAEADRAMYEAKGAAGNRFVSTMV